MRSILATVFLAGLLAPAGAAPVTASGDRPIVLALNPQPEPPGRAKIKRIYTKIPDSRRNQKPIKPKPLNAPATKY